MFFEADLHMVSTRVQLHDVVSHEIRERFSPLDRNLHDCYYFSDAYRRLSQSEQNLSNNLTL